MQSGGYCLPLFVKRDRSLFFAADNIDFLEHTPDGQNTLHGTILVINQQEDDDAPAVNEPLQVSREKSAIEVDIVEMNAPKMAPKPITFTNFGVGKITEGVTAAQSLDLVWFAACYSHQKVREKENNQKSGDDIQVARKTDIMPTWAATNSILQELRNKESEKKRKTRTGIVAPLSRRPPTDVDSLFTTLCMAQGISAEVALDLPENVSDRCLHLKQMLHNKATNCDSVVDEISSSLPKEEIKRITTSGDLGKFLMNYVKQVEALLHLVRATRQCDWPLYLSALEEQVKYYFAHDLYKYAKYVPLHLAQMNEVKQKDPEAWKALERGDFAVARTGIPFTDLFVDQALEQKIRQLKVVGGKTGITQNKEALERYFFITPELSRLKEEFESSFGYKQNAADLKKHHQLTGSTATRMFHNAAKIKNWWKETEEGCFAPVQCTELPAPQAVIIPLKCGCKSSCLRANRCSCNKNGMLCTPLCKCADCGNAKDYDFSEMTDDVIDEEEL
eukprot:gene19658-21605_t